MLCEYIENNDPKLDSFLAHTAERHSSFINNVNDKGTFIVIYTSKLQC